MLQMLGRLMWIGVGAVAVKALEAGLKSNYFEESPTSGSTASGNGNASGTTTKRRTTRRRAPAKPASH